MSADVDPRHLVARVTLGVRWGDMDAFNHVNNAQYLRYLEEARLQWLAGIATFSPLDPVAPVLAASTVNYRKPIEWPSDIVVELFVEKLGNSSLTMGHRIVGAQDSTVLYSDGSVVLVWIDRQAGSSVPLPPAIRAACTGEPA